MDKFPRSEYSAQMSDTQIAQRLYREYTNAQTWDEKNFNRSLENWRYYMAIDADLGLGQWPAAAVDEMGRENRHIATFDICSSTVDQLAGAIQKSPFAVNFSPVDHDLTTLTYTLKDAFYADKELLDWRIHLDEFYIHGLVYRGDLEMYVDEEEYNEPHIGVRTRLPGSVIYDPYWKTPRSKDCKKCFTSAWMTPLKMLETFKNKNTDIHKSVFFKNGGASAATPEKLKMWAHLEENLGHEYGTNNGPFPYYAYTDEMWGSEMKVVSEYSMISVTKVLDYVITIDDETVYLPEELDEVDDKVAWLDANVPDWIPEQVFAKEVTEDIQIVTTICPSLDMNLILERRPTKVQAGRLQFFPWAASHHNGQWKGIIDSIKDAQMQVNYLASMQIHKIQTQGIGGSQFADPSMFESYQEFQKYVRERANPRAVFKLKSGMLIRGSGKISVPTNIAQGSQELSQHLSFILDTMMPKMSRVTPASSGTQESKNESGYLYRQKNIQTQIQQFTIFNGIRNLWNEIGEAYMFQAIPTYGNGVERKINNPATKKSFTINEHVIKDGYEYIVNNMAELKVMRHKVTVTESEDSPTRKVEIMVTTTETMKSMPENKPVTICKMGTKLATSIESFEDEDREELKEIGELEVTVAMQELKTRNAILKQQEINANAATKALQDQMGAGKPGGVGADAGAGEPLPGMGGGAAAQTPDTMAGEAPIQNPVPAEKAAITADAKTASMAMA